MNASEPLSSLTKTEVEADRSSPEEQTVSVTVRSWSSILSSPKIPSLNGIRGLAAMAVVFGHIQRENQFVLAGWIRGYAVMCFFVLSGFLITNLLLQEHDKTNTVSLKNFYIRRSLRIFPAFWIFCAVFLAIYLVEGRHLAWPAYVAAVLYVSDYYMAIHGIGSVMTHTWSLAIKEQFYLLWPFIYKRFSFSQATLEKILIISILFIWVHRMILQYGFHAPGDYIYCAFDTRADALAIGCVMAVLAHADRMPTWLSDKKWLGLVAAITVPAVGMVGGLLAYMLVPMAFAVVILQSVRFYQSPAYRWLNWGFTQRLGLWSYSIYLYHVITHRIVPERLGWLGVALEIVLAVALGAGSYYAVEKPFLAFRERRFRTTREKSVTMASTVPLAKEASGG